MHTSNLEFYGSASSVAFLRHVETLSNYKTKGSFDAPPERSLASRLHNNNFQLDTPRDIPVTPQESNTSADRFHFRVARRFLDAYFSNMHYIQPLFEEDAFLARCEDLWFNRLGKQSLAFVALYYATLSLGSLVMTFDTAEIAGADRFSWSRRLFKDALAVLTQLGQTTSLETVQVYYMLVSRHTAGERHKLEALMMPHVAADQNLSARTQPSRYAECLLAHRLLVTHTFVSRLSVFWASGKNLPCYWNKP